jgi:hypothetical protein
LSGRLPGYVSRQQFRLAGFLSVAELLFQKSKEHFARHTDEMIGTRLPQSLIDRECDVDVLGVEDNLVESVEALGLRDLGGESEPLQD